MSAAATPGAFREQDGQATFRLRSGGGRHETDGRSRVQKQWDRRAPEEWRGVPARWAWVVGDSVDGYGTDSYARYHEESGMLILAKWGFLYTAFPAEWDETADGERDSTATHEGGGGGR